jgi:DNA invertase Pin-like site-specific DNA recombinase
MITLTNKGILKYDNFLIFLILFQGHNYNFISIKDPIDTSTVQGCLLLSIFGSLAEFEQDIILERTKAGLWAAKARGRMGVKRMD